MISPRALFLLPKCLLLSMGISRAGITWKTRAPGSLGKGGGADKA